MMTTPSLTPKSNNNNNKIKGKETITSSAKAWDESLNEICALSDQNLEKIVDLQLAFYPPNENNNKSNVTNNNNNNNNINKKLTSRKNNDINNNNNNNNNANSQIYSIPIPESTTDKKVEFLMRRAKMLDEKIKRGEKDGDISKEEIKNINGMCQQLIDNSKNDKKLILQLKDQINNMKSQMDLLGTQNEDRISKLQTVIFNNNNNRIDDNTIEDIISTRIHQHMDKVVQEVAKTCATEQALFLSKWAERVNYENKHNNNSNNVEKELAKLHADYTRLKGRYDALEIVCGDLRNSVATRDYESQELQRKALSSFRLEMQSTFDSLMRKLNDNLMTVPKFEAMFNELHQKLEILQKHNEQAIQKQLVRIFKLEENESDLQKQVQQQISKMELELKQLKEYSANIAIRVSELDENTAKDLESSFQVSESLKTHIDETIKKSHLELKQHVTSANIAFETFKNNIDSLLSQHQERVDDNFELFSKNMGNFEKELFIKSVTHEELDKQLQSVKEKIDIYKKDMEVTSQGSKQKIDSLSESQKKIRSKLREMYTIVEGVTNTRAAIDSFLQIIKADGFQNSLKSMPDLLERVQNIESKNPIFFNSIDMRLQNLEKNIELKSSELLSVLPVSNTATNVALDVTSPEKDRIAAHVMVEIDKCKHDVYNYVMESLSLFQSETLAPSQIKIDNLGQAVQILSDVVFDIQNNIFNEDQNLESQKKEDNQSPLNPLKITQKSPFFDGNTNKYLSPPESPTYGNNHQSNDISGIKKVPGSNNDIFSSDEEAD